MDTTEDQNSIVETIEAAPGFYGMVKTILNLGGVSKVTVTADGETQESSPEMFATVLTAGFLAMQGIPEEMSAELATMAVIVFEHKGDMTARFVKN